MTVDELRRAINSAMNNGDITGDTEVVIMMTTLYVLQDSQPYYPFELGYPEPSKGDERRAFKFFCDKPAEPLSESIR